MDKNGAKHLYGILNRPSPKVLRLLRGPTSQSALAVYLNLTVNSITDWECNRTCPSPGSLFDLLQHYMKWTGKLGWPALDLLLAAAELAAELDQVDPPVYEIQP